MHVEDKLQKHTNTKLIYLQTFTKKHENLTYTSA